MPICERSAPLRSAKPRLQVEDSLVRVEQFGLGESANEVAEDARHVPLPSMISATSLHLRWWQITTKRR